jgi:hypothetical protein
MAVEFWNTTNFLREPVLNRVYDCRFIPIEFT